MSESTLKPFHESVVDYIRQAENGHELGKIGRFLMQTKIPKGHDEIVAAWNEKAPYFAINSGDVAESVTAQKPSDLPET